MDPQKPSIPVPAELAINTNIPNVPSINIESLLNNSLPRRSPRVPKPRINHGEEVEEPAGSNSSSSSCLLNGNRRRSNASRAQGSVSSSARHAANATDDPSSQTQQPTGVSSTERSGNTTEEDENVPKEEPREDPSGVDPASEEAEAALLLMELAHKDKLLAEARRRQVEDEASTLVLLHTGRNPKKGPR